MESIIDKSEIYRAGYKQVEKEQLETKLIHECLQLIPDTDNEAREELYLAHTRRRNQTEIFNFTYLKDKNIDLYNRIIVEYGLLEFLRSRANLN
jgi:hypothetical protein